MWSRPRPPIPRIATRIRSLGAVSVAAAHPEAPVAKVALPMNSLRLTGMFEVSVKSALTQLGRCPVRFHAARCGLPKFHRLESFRICDRRFLGFKEVHNFH